MSQAAIAPIHRDQLNGAYRALRKATGLGAWLVKAYVLATYRRGDVAEALAVAHYGVGVGQLGPGAHEAIARWRKRLDAVNAAGRLG